MKKYNISTAGHVQTIANFFGKPNNTVNFWAKNPSNRNHKLATEMLKDLKEAQIKVLEKWEEKLTGIIELKK